MVIKSKTIQECVIAGTDENFLKFVDLLKGIAPATPTQEYLNDIADGAWKYIQGLLYQGSQGNIQNIEGLLKAPNEEEIRTILSQWKEMEQMSWTVVGDDEV